ncbi:MAG: 3-phosphoserine/phosphohydroxythreonine transaminase [Methylophaga sp.]|nr:3-phosphoserine/phosphohydroxythreonine transaminase [Methylophaga sp.]
MYNFSAGPAQLPPEVLTKAKNEFLDWHGCGMSVMEMPFTSDEFKEITKTAYQDLSQLINLPNNYRTLFLQGGAYAHFSLVAMNLLGHKTSADYVQTGHWSTRAINEAKRYGHINIAASSEQDEFNHIPAFHQWNLDPEAAYCHITTNETANGVQFQKLPDITTPLVADVTSDFLTRQMDISKFGLIYASAQKNIGPSGLTIVIIRDDLLDQAMDIVPAVFNYGRQAANNARVNTPSTYSVYMAGLMFSWLLQQGGIEKIEQQNSIKAKRLYDAIDNDDFYLCTVNPADRSLANICFELTDPDLAEDFVNQAKENGLLNLKGHGVRGGIRASNYNAMPIGGIDALIDFMQSYSASHSNMPLKKHHTG